VQKVKTERVGMLGCVLAFASVCLGAEASPVAEAAEVAEVAAGAIPWLWWIAPLAPCWV